MGDKSDLKVNYELLDSSETSLKTLRTEFKRCTKRQDSLAEDVGAGKMKDAMHEFANNWSGNRKQLLWNLGETLELVQNVKKSFKDLDKDLGKKAKGEK
ncbi:hypothetical protein ABZU86_10300 [Streptomyces sp. NPDC005271]|uniref:hypothetical protein n=1 Tax=unclassified Streptomyces TaxID=2593676 RepID=UPI0033B39852